jgi:thiol:disulfide interchange protein DsbD
LKGPLGPFLFKKRLKMKKWLLALAVVLCSAGATIAQQSLHPIKWSYEVKQTAANEYDLIFTATIEKTWHLYSQHIKRGGPVPTSFTFDKNDDYTRVDSVQEKSEGEKIHDPNFDMDIIYFANKAVFVQHIKTKKPLSKVTGKLEYMCCDNEKCLPPEELPFTFKLNKK